MTEKIKEEPRKRILETAAELFAQKGYYGVGVREIAQRSEVNVSMISYYFKGKSGILKEIIEIFHQQYYETIEETLKKGNNQKEKVENFVKELIRIVRENTNITLAVFNTLPLDIPEIEEIKIQKIKKIIRNLGQLLVENGIDYNDKPAFCALGPSLLSMILFHFRIRPVQMKVFDIECDDHFYEIFADKISQFFIGGINQVNQNKENSQ